MLSLKALCMRGYSTVMVAVVLYVFGWLYFKFALSGHVLRIPFSLGLFRNGTNQMDQAKTSILKQLLRFSMQAVRTNFTSFLRNLRRRANSSKLDTCASSKFLLAHPRKKPGRYRALLSLLEQETIEFCTTAYFFLEKFPDKITQATTLAEIFPARPLKSK